MIVSTIQSISVAAAAAVLAAAAFAVLPRRSGGAALLSAALLAVVLPRDGHALEIRRGNDLATVAAGETIDDTVAFFGETVSVDGNVNGDLIAFARNVIVRGNVSGDVIAFAETVTVEGSVTGNTFGFGRNVALVRAQVGRNLYGFGRDVTVATGTSVGGNATMFGNSIAMRGRVGVDLTSFAAEHEISGEVVRNAETFGQEVRVLASARIGGNLTAHVGDEERVQTASGATIGGTTNIDIEGPRVPENPYLTAGYYVRQAVRVAAAFLVGLLLLAVFPALRELTLGSAGSVLRDAGVGFIALIALPVASLILCVTIVGIPLGVLGFLSWLIALYLAKILVAVVIGRALFSAPGREAPHHAALLLAGLVVIMIVINVPFVGELLNFVLTLVGLGMLVLQAIAGSRFGARPLAA